MPTPSKRQVTITRSGRTVNRGLATKSVNLVNNSFDSVNAQNLADANILLKKLRSIQKDLQKANELLHSAIAEDDLEEDIKKSLEYDEKVSDAINSLEVRIDMYNQSCASHSSAAGGGSGNSSVSKAIPKLPKLELITFEGDPLLWQTFWDDFTSSVDKHDNISTIDKFKLLRSVLRGKALRVADGYLLTAANYANVKDELYERFGDPQVAIFAHFENLLALQPANHDLAQLRRVHDTCESHFRSLVALGLSEDTFGQVFVPILLSKFPKFVKMELHRKNGEKKWTLASLRALLKDEIRARDKCEYQQSSQGGSASGNSQGPRKSNPPTSTSTLLLGGGGTQGSSKGSPGGSFPKPKPGCAFCQGQHASWKCRTHSDVESRRKQHTNRCLSCLQVGHSIKECRKRQKCFYCQSDSHKSALCRKQFDKTSPPSHPLGQSSSAGHPPPHAATTTQPASRPPGAPNSAGTFPLSPGAPPFAPNSSDSSGLANFVPVDGKSFALLKSAKSVVSGESYSTPAQILFDDGSTMSFIRYDVAQKIGAKPISVKNTAVTRFGDNSRSPLQLQAYLVHVRVPTGHVIPVTLHGTNNICAPMQVVPMDVAQFPFIADMHLAQPLVAQPTMAQVDILIGLDFYYQFLGSEHRRLPNGVVFLNSILGYVASGYVQNLSQMPFVSANTQLLTLTEFDMEKFWQVENIGIESPSVSSSADDEYAQNHFDAHISVQNGRYVVKWPYKYDSPILSDNYTSSLARLYPTVKRLKEDPAAMLQYSEILSEQESRGIIEPAPVNPEGPVYYMPHHAVFKPKSATTKVRIVYDASAKPNKAAKSLNDCLLRGPVILSDLVGSLLRFRLHRIALISDIEKAFHMVALACEDRDVTRFLWLKDVNGPTHPNNLRILRFCRVPFGTVASSFLLAATICHHLKSKSSKVAKDILDNTYVDNVLGGAATLSEALEYYNEAKSKFAGASMNLRQWFSNSSEFVHSIDPADFGQDRHTSVLGIQWDTHADTLVCGGSVSSMSSESTKQTVLSALASLFDPCGWFSPVTTACRLLIQELWRDGYEWDTKLPSDILNRWELLKNDLVSVSSYHVPRYLGVTPNTDFQLHCFVDASSKAYAAVVYLRSLAQSCELASCQLLCSKSKVSPLKSLSIPRLELLAAVIGIRLLLFVSRELRMNVSYSALWSDSKCVLSWYRHMGKLPSFVQSKVSELRQADHVQLWYVPSEQNPADIPSRGQSLRKFVANPLWWNGPDFLQRDCENWPKQDPLPADTYIESDGADSINIVQTTELPDHIFDASRFSSLSKMVRVASFVLRFIRKCRRQQTFSGKINAVEFDSSLIFLIIRVQHQYYHNLSLFNRSHSTSPLVKQLRLFLDQKGIIRSRGRLSHSGLSDATNHPILLPKQSPFTVFIIRDIHARLIHTGPGTKATIAALRQRYWVPAARVLIKRVIRDCKLCKLFDKRPFGIPQAPPLPNFRVNLDRPFACVGIVYLGPLLVKSDTDHRKVWVCLFTCSASRALHLEVVDSLSASDFLLCFRRFTSICDIPKLVVSDNATQFKASDKLIAKLFRETLRDDLVQNYSTQKGIVWKFITELSPWFGGFYERLVRPVKSCLHKALDKRCVQTVELQTLCYEISAVLNSRPLVYSENEAGDIALTPANLMAKSGSILPDFSDGADEFRPPGQQADHRLEAWNRRRKALDIFWQQWRHQYLTSLREKHHDMNQRNSSATKPTVGMTVIVKDALPRGKWLYGRITKLIHSNDGQCRSVELLLPDKKRIYRPIKLLYPLESDVLSDTDTSTSNISVRNSQIVRPRRAAALAARAKIRDLSSEELI